MLFEWRVGQRGLLQRIALGAVVASVLVLSAASPVRSAPAPRTAPSSAASASPCVYYAPTEAITGARGSASAIGWAGNYQGVVTCLGGSFYVQSGIERRFGFGIYGGGPTSWADAAGYLPAQITSFRRFGTNVEITEFADELLLGGRAFVAVYCRVAITNPTGREVVADPAPTPGLIDLHAASDSVAAHASVAHDYVVAVDRFGRTYPWPSAAALRGAGSFDQHFAHMHAFWDAQLSHIAQVNVPDQGLNNAYRSGFIYTEIARSGNDLDTGVNNYEMEFSHDVIGILANRFTQGDYEDARALLLEARSVVGVEAQYEDGVWTYSWPWAIYLLKTGDRSFVKANLHQSGPAGAADEPSIAQTAHQIAHDRTGPNGIMGVTNDIDSDGYWTVDNFEALMGLASYRYLAHAVGDVEETRWATNEYRSLLGSVNRTLAATMHRYGLDYLPCGMLEPNTSNRCTKPEDANWASPLSGRWPWDAQLFGAPVSGPGVAMIDATYAYGFGRLVGKLPAGTFGGFPGDYYSSGYNAGYGNAGLMSTNYRDQGILGYEFMLSHTQSGPYSWWESVSAPVAGSPWVGSHPASGQGSSPHTWGIANANKILLDSVVSATSSDSLIVGRGVPDTWIAPGCTISVTNFPTTGNRRIGVTITAGDRSVTLKVHGSFPAGGVLFELPAFVHNIASSSAGTISQRTGTVTLTGDTKAVTVHLVR